MNESYTIKSLVNYNRGEKVKRGKLEVVRVENVGHLERVLAASPIQRLKKENDKQILIRDCPYLGMKI